MIERMKQVAAQMVAERATQKLGTVYDYDPDSYSVRVEIMPTGEITGWMPIGSDYVGAGFGLAIGPTIGDMVRIDPIEGSKQVAVVGSRFFNDVDTPLPVPSGEAWLVHKSGSLLKFHNDGTVEIASASDLSATVGGNLTANVAGDISATAAGSITETAPTITLKGNIVLDGPISQANTAGGSTTATLIGPLNVTNDVTGGGISLDSHVHTDPQGGNTGGPV